MNSVGDIVLNNGESTPVAHTFEPTAVGPNLVEYREPIADYRNYNSGTERIYEARPLITIGNRPLKSSGDNYKVTLRVRVPVVEDLSIDSNDAKVTYVNSASIEFIIPGRAGSASAADLLAFVKNLLSETQVVNTITAQQLPV